MREIKCMKPREVKRTVNGKETIVYRCPHCGMTLAVEDDNCNGCGIFIDWGDDLWATNY